MSRQDGAASTWPMLLALAALFALCLTAPRAWYGSAPTQSLVAQLGKEQGQPTLAPPKKKRQVVVGQDDHSLASRKGLPDLEAHESISEPIAIETMPRVATSVDLPRIELANLERLPHAGDVVSADNGSPSPALDQPFGVSAPVSFYPEAGIASGRSAPTPLPLGPHPMAPTAEQKNAPATSATTTSSQSAIESSGGRRPIVTAAPQLPSTPQLPASEASAQPAATGGSTPSLQATADRTASRPKRDELPLPAAASPSPSALATPKLETQPEVSPAPSTTPPPWWPVPHELLAQLEKFGNHPLVAPWSSEVRQALVALGQESQPQSSRSQEIINELSDLLSQLNTLVSQAGDTPLGDELRRTGYSLTRRLDMWTILPQLKFQPAEMTITAQSPQRLQTVLSEVVAVASQGPRSDEWRDYLLIDSLKKLASQRESLRLDEQRTLISGVLKRVDAALPAWKQQHEASEALASLGHELRHFGREPVNTRALIADIERFELSQHPNDAKPIAVSYLKLARSPDLAEQQLARQIETHYRNANVRLTFTADMVNRFLARTDQRSTPVNDTVAGMPTRGWSRTHTDVHVRFIPDPTRVRMALEARGKIFSQTYTVSGPVTVHSDADSSFVAAKELQLSMQGFNVGETEVEAQSFPRLKHIESKINLPFIRSLIQGVARNQYDETAPKATAEAKRKIRTEVRSHLDEEISDNIRNGNSFFREHVTEPLDTLGIPPHLIESQTTADRVTMRLRMATSEQLSGHGPRPRAPSNALASMQMHESALNNVLNQLGWSGKTYTLPELRDQVAKQLKTTIDLPDEDNLKDLHLTFAADNALRVRCREGHLELNLAFARLRKGQQTWKDFQVRVFYKPDLSQAGAPFGREGTVQLIGDRLNTGAQIALRGIFSKAFPPSRQMKLIPDKLVAAKPGLADVIVTQCDIRDGWMGIALALRPEAKQLAHPEPKGPLRTGLLPLLHR